MAKVRHVHNNAMTVLSLYSLIDKKTGDAKKMSSYKQLTEEERYHIYTMRKYDSEYNQHRTEIVSYSFTLG